MLQRPFFQATASWTASGSGGRRVTRSARATSHQSPEEAERLAREKARRLAEEAIEGRAWERRYAYGDRPLVEPVLERLGIPGTPGSAVLTVNAYGSEVMNAEQLMFVDVDLPPVRKPGFFSRLFGKGEQPKEPVSEALDRLADLVASSNEVRVRAYRTAAGLRYIFVNSPHDATTQETADLMARLGADRKFVLLCRVQKCFRARLTPKPWRCGLYAEHPKFAGNGEEPSADYREWKKDYESAAAGFATCRFLEEYGNGVFDPALRELVTRHDTATRSASAFPLA